MHCSAFNVSRTTSTEISSTRRVGNDNNNNNNAKNFRNILPPSPPLPFPTCSLHHKPIYAHNKQTSQLLGNTSTNRIFHHWSLRIPWGSLILGATSISSWNDCAVDREKNWPYSWLQPPVSWQQKPPGNHYSLECDFITCLAIHLNTILWSPQPPLTRALSMKQQCTRLITQLLQYYTNEWRAKSPSFFEGTGNPRFRSQEPFINPSTALPSHPLKLCPN